jgi:hypothetical protein
VKESYPRFMKTPTLACKVWVAISAGCLLSLASLSLWADQVEMQSGDRYFGKVLSVSTNTVVLQSDVLGTVNLPRSKVATISLGAVATKSALTTTSPATHFHPRAATNSLPDFSGSLSQLGTNKSAIEQVRAEYLSAAGPEANAKFNELLGGFMSGKVTVNDLRAQAKSAAEQLRTARRDLGEEAGPAIDGYLAILDNFLQ